MSLVRAAVYARFSSDLQRETSLQDQIATARRMQWHMNGPC